MKTMSENILIYCFFFTGYFALISDLSRCCSLYLVFTFFQVGKRTCSSTMVVQKKSVSGQHRRTCKN